MARYADSLTMRDARRQYFDANGFGDGGYEDAWVALAIGPFPVAFPNTAQRVRSVRLHDLHHVVTDYGTDITGEAEIGAWEIASHCRDHYAAWVLNLYAMGIGILIAPRLLWTAFLRGRRSANLYEQDFRDEMLDESVRELRERLGLLQAPAPASLPDFFAFAAWTAAGFVLLVATAALVLSPLLLLGMLLVGAFV